MNTRVDTDADAMSPRSQRTADAPASRARPLAATIARHRGEAGFGYEALREQAIAWVEALSGASWTDYNEHDPGVTLLEALCFALTENVFGAEQPLTDLLTAPDGRIHYRRHGLHAAEEILPCRPCTSSDYVRWLLDRVPGALQVHAAMPDGDGLWRFDLEVTTSSADKAVAAAARAYWAQRNLGEDLDGRPAVLQPRWCRLQLDLNIEGTRAPEEILAELVARCAEHVDAAPRRQSLSERLAAMDGDDPSLAEVFDGPRLRQGWIAADSLARDADKRVYFGDLARLAASVDGVSEVRQIGLVVEDEDDSVDVMMRRGKDWVLRLRWPDASEALSAWRITRRGTPIALAVGPLLHRLDDLWRGAGGRASADGSPTMAGSPLARPKGRFVEPEPYVSLFRQLPRIYRERFDAALGPAEKADADQFRAYLALLEQWLANGAAQNRYVRELYTLDTRVRPSYAWQVLGDAHIPELDALYTTHAERVLEEVFSPADAELDRRGRVLDHLLALHGEECGQGSIRPFGWYFGAEAWRLHLYEQKRQMLLRIAPLTRDRYGAIDYSRQSLGRRGNTSALQQWTSLLLAFRDHHDRLLMHPLAEAGIGLADEQATFVTADAAPPTSEPLILWGASRPRVVGQLGAGLTRAVPMLGRHFSALDPRALPPALLRVAVHAERYRHAGPGALWLGPDENGRWWTLQLRSPRTPAEAAAICLHELACRLQLAGEGMHLVEHVLLRPISRDDTDIPADFYRHRLTAVLPGWTARGRDSSFRRVAEETLALNTPAHLQIRALWLDASAMARFERCFAAWLDARQAYGAAVADAGPDQARGPAERLENWARLLRWMLWRQASQAGSDQRRGTA